MPSSARARPLAPGLHPREEEASEDTTLLDRKEYRETMAATRRAKDRAFDCSIDGVINLVEWSIDESNNIMGEGSFTSKWNPLWYVCLLVLMPTQQGWRYTSGRLFLACLHVIIALAVVVVVAASAAAKSS